ncbi:FIVAR domain-containing protein [Amphibacillus sp. MSJ-3]|uniref:FIVAR domain-containing protein n=1 Tax=Amphibacillus sp. MSJ-3 TaxID=2841505 RepID=UPI001C0EC093|nr:FIVAR domain-containing protein [Amphibacillus sp. MSJ-3]MBU5595264.1 FIVAR domain-containing protein [Amphibacillus sp. MSJ-3]
MAKRTEEAERLAESDYTKQSFAKLTKVLEAAHMILTDDEATQEEIDKALVTLEQAIKALETVPSDSTDPKDESSVVDKDEDSDSLPETATSMYNWILAGFIFLLASGLMLLWKNRKA